MRLTVKLARIITVKTPQNETLLSQYLYGNISIIKIKANPVYIFSPVKAGSKFFTECLSINLSVYADAVKPWLSLIRRKPSWPMPAAKGV